LAGAAVFWGLGVKWLGSREVKLATHFHLVLRLRMSGATPLLPLSFFHGGLERDKFVQQFWSFHRLADL